MNARKRVSPGDGVCVCVFEEGVDSDMMPLHKRNDS